MGSVDDSMWQGTSNDWYSTVIIGPGFDNCH